MFETVLIANRGEIARRIIRSCRNLGFRTVAVCSDADRNAPFAREADVVVPIGPPPARSSYLRVEAIIDAAQKAGAQAIHPGYGFLAEKPELARACLDTGLIFVGPSADVIEQMGSKIGAKRLALAAGVPVVPGFDKDDGNDETLIAAAWDVGFPLFVKASAGGGGKGMRAVPDAASLPQALIEARAESRSAFGDDRLLLERLVLRPRHVEVQIAADHYGNVVHLFERDCSVQRNNQKVFEEAPAPNLPDAVRERLFADAIGLARSIGYRNLGTMEFLYDGASGDYFFLEMNTRLQVEHPVTEAVTGLDLVALQLTIAAGKPLPFLQEELRLTGHAIEARLTAERPEAGFAPAVGRIAEWIEPSPRDGIRIDSAVEAGSEITVHYDSMIAKVIAHGSTRGEALRRLRHALDDLVVLGPETNRTFLLDASHAGPFAEGVATTATLNELFPLGWQRPAAAMEHVAAIAAAASIYESLKAQRSAPTPWRSLAGFRLLAGAGRHCDYDFVVDTGAEQVPARVRVAPYGIKLLLAGAEVDITFEKRGRYLAFSAAGDTGIVTRDEERHLLRIGRAEHCVRVLSRAQADDKNKVDSGGSNFIVASMPGVVVNIGVSAGQSVTAGQPVMTLESMKLFVPLPAPRDGCVKTIHARAGDTVGSGAKLIELEPSE